MTSCKEYLEKQPDGTYALVLRGDLCKESDILIPEGAEAAMLYKSGEIEFFKENYAYFWFDKFQEWKSTKNVPKFYKSASVIWQRDQDEPFLTPETTLNDQYAEIEQVRRVEIHGTVKAKPDLNFGAAQASGGVDATLTERQSQYGCYEDVAHVTQQILSALRIGNYDKLPAPMKESLHMIASKMARIVNGDPEYLDNWHDIGGYAKLIEKLIKGN